MRSRALALLSLTLFLAASCSGASGRTNARHEAAPQEPFTMPENVSSSELFITKLSNGLTVAVQPDHRFPLVSLRLYVHAGSAYEQPDQAGISHLLEHMVFKGTEKRPKGAISSQVEEAGGYLNAATSYDYTYYLTDMPAASWKLGLDILKDMAFHPSLDPAELESEKDVVLSELKRGEDAPGGRMFKRHLAAALAGTPYERPIIGYPETLRTTSADSMRAYIDRLYQPQSMLLLVVGDITTTEVLNEAASLFGGLENQRPVMPQQPINRADLPDKGPYINIEKTPWNKVYLTLSFPAYDQADPRATALDMAAQLLGGDETGYLYRRYRYQLGLVDSISAANYSFERLGLFAITATLSPENLERFWNTFSRDLANLPEHKFSSREFERARLNIEDSLYRQQETLSGYASKLGYFLFFGSSPQEEQNYLAQIALTDQKAVTELLHSLFKANTAVLTILRPEQNAPGLAVSEAGLARSLEAALPAEKAAVSAAKDQPAAEAEVMDLGHDRTLILLPDQTLPYAAVDLIFQGGDSLNGPHQQGLAALTASMLTKGAKSMSANQIEDYQADRASSLSATAGRQTFALSLRYPARFEGDMFGLLSAVLNGATLPQSELGRVKQQQEAAIIRRDDQPLSLAFSKIYPLLFGDHPYGYTLLGDKEQVAAYTRADILEFWKKQTARPWVMAICGTFDRDAAIKAALSLPVPTVAPAKLASPQWGSQKELTIPMPGREQAHLFLIFPAARSGSDDEAGLDLLQSILAGQSGLLFRDLRDTHGLGYTVTAFQAKQPEAGALIFYIGTEKDKLDQARQGFLRVIEELKASPLPEAEIARGKQQVQGDFIRGRQRLSARSGEAAGLAVLGRPIDAEAANVAKIQSLNAQDLLKLTRRYLDTDKAYTVTVMP